MDAADAADPLGAFRDRFAIPAGLIYLDGHSLGALPVASAARMRAVVEREWGDSLIGGWNVHDWIGAPARVGAKLARIVGAGADEVIVADSTSINLHKLLHAACAARPERGTILTEAGNFPTDLYVAQGVAALLGRRLRAVPAADAAAAIDGDTAVVLLTHVDYRTAALHDMAAVTTAAQAAGALMLWDLSHSAGAVALDLAGCGVDLAVGCGYKYLNGGPGAPAFLYVRRDLQAQLVSPLPGWMGHAAPFDFVGDHVPAPGIARFLCGTPPVLGLAALEAAIDLMLEADPARRVAKAQALGERFRERAAAAAARHGVMLASPADPARRGGHLAYAHPEAFAICQALIEARVIGDFRAPDILRFGFSPLYLRFAEVDRAAAIFSDILDERRWDDPRYRVRGRVT